MWRYVGGESAGGKGKKRAGKVAGRGRERGRGGEGKRKRGE